MPERPQWGKSMKNRLSEDSRGPVWHEQQYLEPMLFSTVDRARDELHFDIKICENFPVFDIP